MSHDTLRYYFKSGPKLDLNLRADICVYGGNSGGIIAAIAAKRKGYSVVLLEAGRHLGGLTAGGLGRTDVGNRGAIGGLAREFYQRVGRLYGKDEMWQFEPHIASQAYREWLEELDIHCHLESYLESVEMKEDRILSLTTTNGIHVQARQFIDASYEGDLMALAGVSYTVGREDNRQYGEAHNGAQIEEKHQFELNVDPYRVEGDPSSGLLPGIDPSPYERGKGDRRIQAYNFRLCLTDNPDNRLPITKPADYNRSDYELLIRYCRAGYVPKFERFDHLLNDKIDLNNHGAVSTDYVGMNHDYPEGSYEERERIFQAHVRWIKGLLWFWANDPEVPTEYQEAFKAWGWCKDEFTETGGFSPALYVREARRLVGDVVMTEHHSMGKETVTDPIALAAYQIDSHNCRRLVIDGKVRNEGDVQKVSGPPYPISYRSIIPAKGECQNLCVPFCLSASHTAFGSIRMEPVFMILAHSSVEAACLAMEEDVAVQDVLYSELRQRLLQAGQVLDPVPAVKDLQAGV